MPRLDIGIERAMVAEPTLFLTKDRQVQVRAHLTKKGRRCYCVKDFIRQIACKPIGPDDAMVYWLCCLTKLLDEREIVDSQLVLFHGPYEVPNICISAQGLLILYSYMNTHYAWVDKTIKDEVQGTLEALGRSDSWDKYVEMHDDGEVEEQNAEGGVGGSPPEGSRFHYKDDQVVGGGMTEEEIEAAFADNSRALKELEDRLQAKTSELAQTEAELEAMRAEQSVKRRKLQGIRLGALVDEAHKTLSSAERDSLCKSVVANFKRRFPDRESFLRHGVIHFFEEDRPVVQALINEMHTCMMTTEEVSFTKGSAATDSPRSTAASQ